MVTSATGPVARARLTRAGLPLPRVLVGAEDVRRGKPAPDPYLLAATQLGVDAGRCVGVEDTPAGLAALRAAGMRAIGMCTTHDVALLDAADAIVLDLGALRVGVGAVGW